MTSSQLATYGSEAVGNIHLQVRISLRNVRICSRSLQFSLAFGTVVLGFYHRKTTA
jgi:hypothetical protein